MPSTKTTRRASGKAPTKAAAKATATGSAPDAAGDAAPLTARRRLMKCLEPRCPPWEQKSHLDAMRCGIFAGMRCHVEELIRRVDARLQAERPRLEKLPAHQMQESVQRILMEEQQRLSKENSNL